MHRNVYSALPPLQKEKDHVAPDAPEGRTEKLEERYCIRPNVQTLFCEHFHDIIHSWRDLPKMYNQWCSAGRRAVCSCATASSWR